MKNDIFSAAGDGSNIIVVEPTIKNMAEQENDEAIIYLAIIIAYDYKDELSYVRDDIKAMVDDTDFLEKLKGNWDDIDYDIYYIDPSAPAESFAEAIEKIDNITGPEDRVLLLLLGHGLAREDGSGSISSYYFVLARKQDKEVVVTSDYLAYAFGVIGVAIDFIWFLSCYSGAFINDIGENIDYYVGGVVVWGYNWDVLILYRNTDSDLPKDVKSFWQLVVYNEITVVDDIYRRIYTCPDSTEYYDRTVILVQLDLYDFDGNSLVLSQKRPPEPVPSTGHSWGGPPTDWGYVSTIF